jgi:hypothetical protein
MKKVYKWPLKTVSLIGSLIIFLSVLFVLPGCGGGGGGNYPDYSYDPENIWISSPSYSGGTYYTDRPTVEIGGGSYIPSTAECTSWIGDIGPGYTVSWHNSANGRSGNAHVQLNCLTIVFVFWNILSLPLEPGANEITVRVVGQYDGIDDTDTITVYQVPDTTPPELTRTSPFNNGINISIASNITATFNEAMDESSLNETTFILKDQNQNSITGSISYSEWNGYTAKFTPDFLLDYSNTYTATITTGVSDYHGGNNLQQDYSWSFTTRSNPDITPPEIIDTSPVQNSYCASVNSPVSVTFDEAIDPETLSSSSFYLHDASNNLVTSTLSYSEPVASLHPQTNLTYNSNYIATITTAISDNAGNGLDSDYVLNFSTMADEGNGNWIATSLNGAPTDLNSPVAVWTGEEMVVWGLEISYEWNSGMWFEFESGRGNAYDPVTDSWSELSSVNQPSGRLDVSVVWTGTEMIIWGGYLDGSEKRGGSAYNPNTDSWRTISNVGAPSARRFHKAVWTGSEMIIWGGVGSGRTLLNGARYNPVNDSWTPVSAVNAPIHTKHFLDEQSAVWTGTEMIIWNNWVPEESARYNPVTDSWTPVSTINAPTNLTSHRAVWTGTEMLVWGDYYRGQGGARYNPAIDSWSNISMLCAPESRQGMEVVWTGKNLVIWGGSINNGAMYEPLTDSWQMMNIANSPSLRRDHIIVWTGSEVIVWGGLSSGNNRLASGGRFFPSGDL